MKQIVYAELKAHVDAGMKRKELAELYELPESQMAEALKQAGLRIRKLHKPKFELVGMPTEVENSVEETIVDVNDSNEESFESFSEATAVVPTEESYTTEEEVQEEPSFERTNGGW